MGKKKKKKERRHLLFPPNTWETLHQRYLDRSAGHLCGIKGQVEGPSVTLKAGSQEK